LAYEFRGNIRDIISYISMVCLLLVCYPIKWLDVITFFIIFYSFCTVPPSMTYQVCNIVHNNHVILLSVKSSEFRFFFLLFFCLFIFHSLPSPCNVEDVLTLIPCYKTSRLVLFKEDVLTLIPSYHVTKLDRNHRREKSYK
jgi:hypothetical protein